MAKQDAITGMLKDVSEQLAERLFVVDDQDGCQGPASLSSGCCGAVGSANGRAVPVNRPAAGARRS